MGSEIKRSSEVSCWQASMRAALYNGVTENDMADIVRGLVERAKKGDLKAADMLFKWTMGQPQVTVKQTVVMRDGDSIEPIDVIERLPGEPTPEEIAERRLRIRDERERRRRRR